MAPSINSFSPQAQSTESPTKKPKTILPDIARHNVVLDEPSPDTPSKKTKNVALSMWKELRSNPEAKLMGIKWAMKKLEKTVPGAKECTDPSIPYSSLLGKLQDVFKAKGATVSSEVSMATFFEKAPKQVQIAQDEALLAVWPRIREALTATGNVLTIDGVLSATAIREFLKNNQESLSCVTQLNISDLGLRVIPNEIKYFENLRVLDLKNNQISDLFALRGLTKLLELYLNNNRINDISFLSGLTNLKRLDLSNNWIKDISVIQKIKFLEILLLSHNSISDISYLAGLRNLLTLDLSKNLIGEIRFLAGLTTLKTLNLSGNRISDIIGLTILDELEELDLSHNNIQDIHPLEPLTGHRKKLCLLDLSHNEISDIRPLASLWLKELNLSHNQINSIHPLDSRTNLRKLNLNENKISSVHYLKNAGLLEKLYIQNNPEINPAEARKLKDHLTRCELHELHTDTFIWIEGAPEQELQRKRKSADR